MKKLLIATDCCLPRWDGIARFLSEVVPTLSRHYKITVVAPNYGGKYTIKGVKIIRVPTFSFRIGDYKPSKPEVKKIQKLVDEADLVWSQTIGPIGAMSILAANKQKKKVISYVHSLEWDLFVHSISVPKRLKGKVGSAAKKIVTYIYNKCNLLMVPSKEIGLTLSKAGIKTPKKVVTLGTDLEKFSPGERKPGKFTIGFCGRIGREKDLPTLYKAFKEVKKKHDVELMIVGDGLKKILKPFKEAKIIGPSNNVVRYLRQMDVFVLPSLTETSSLATMEAMACGLPVVATKVGYVKRYIKNNVNGIFFQKQNHSSLAKKLIRLKKNPELRRRLGINARRTMVHKFSWENTLAQLLDIFKRF